MGLRGEDVDLRRRQIVVERAVWRDVIDSPKSGRGRILTMTDALAEALGKMRVARGVADLRRDDGEPSHRRDLSRWLRSAQRRANVKVTEGPHILRHALLAHLAMRGARQRPFRSSPGTRT